MGLTVLFCVSCSIKSRYYPVFYVFRPANKYFSIGAFVIYWVKNYIIRVGDSIGLLCYFHSLFGCQLLLRNKGGQTALTICPVLIHSPFIVFDGKDKHCLGNCTLLTAQDCQQMNLMAHGLSTRAAEPSCTLSGNSHIPSPERNRGRG